MLDEISCFECGSVMVRDEKPIEVNYKGHLIKLSRPGYYCTSCGEGAHTAADMDVIEPAFVKLKSIVDCLTGGDASP